jgi:integrase
MKRNFPITLRPIPRSGNCVRTFDLYQPIVNGEQPDAGRKSCKSSFETLTLTIRKLACPQNTSSPANWTYSLINALPLTALRTACKRAGLQRIDWHTLRHTHGTLLHSQGTPLKVAQAQLGHSHMATTLEIYTHASGSAQRDAVNLLEEQLFPNVPKLESCGNIAEKESQLVQ